MQEERLRSIVLEELKKKNRPKSANEFFFRVITRLGYDFSDPDHRQEMPSHETISRIARDLKTEFPELKGSQQEQDRRQELAEEFRQKYSKTIEEEYPTVSKYINY